MIRLPSKNNKSVLSLDMAPMIDMTFLLLIFFILNTHFIKDTGVDVSLPKAQTGVSRKADIIRVAITASGTVHMENHQVDAGSVSRRVRRLLANNPGAPAIVTADRNARTGLLIRVVDQIKLAGVKDISIATEAE